MTALALNCAIGRLVTVRNSPVPLGFMPLKRFHLDTALDASAVVALRSARLTGDSMLATGPAVADWLDRLAVNLLGEMVPRLSRARPLPVVEVGAGAGPLFERLKALPDGSLGAYTAVGPAAEAIRFALLHDGDGAYDYVDEIDLAGLDEAALVLNQNQAVRHGHGLDLDWLGLAAARRSATVLALRVALADDAARQTVNGHVVPLPGVARARAALREAGAGWRVRLLAGFDDGFFLPADGAAPPEDDVRRKPTTGLLLAALAADDGMAGFQAA